MKKVTMLAMVASLAMACTVGGDEVGDDGALITADTEDEFAIELDDPVLGAIHFEALRTDASTVESRLYVDGELWTSLVGPDGVESLAQMQAIADDAQARGLNPSQVEFSRYAQLAGSLTDALVDEDNPLAQLLSAHTQSINGMQIATLEPEDESENAFYMTTAVLTRAPYIARCKRDSSRYSKRVEVRVSMSKDQVSSHYCHFLDYIDTNRSFTGSYSLSNLYFGTYHKRYTINCELMWNR